MDINTEVRYIKGVGPVKAAALKRLNIETVKDLIDYAPMRYEDRTKVRSVSEIEDGEKALIYSKVVSRKEVRLRARKSLLKIILEDDSGCVEISAFNQAYLKEIFKPDREFLIYAKFSRDKGGLKTSSFNYELKEKSDNKNSVHTARIVPIYQLTQGLNQKSFRKMMYEVLNNLDVSVEDYLPVSLRKKYKFLSIQKSISEIHFPSNLSQARKARSSLVFREFFLFQLALSFQKNSIKKISKNRTYIVKKNLLTEFKNRLGFEFTKDQKKAINELFTDMMSDWPMKRLLQGEVGSGKTVVALAVLLLAVENSYSGLIIAPTEILAEQHYLTFKTYLAGMGVNIKLLVGNMKKSIRNKILQDMSSGKIDIIIGTHALLQEDVDISHVSVVVIDEQHKFGVKQKAALIEKCHALDVLSMSATPIPRTLAMSVYGDLDISTIKILPKDRKKAITKYLSSRDAYNFAKQELDKGNLLYIVHPLVEESEILEVKSAETMFAELRNSVFKNYSCGLLHGRMSSEEKEQVMTLFSNSKIQVLFTTTVVEVGINVPQANVMIIEDFNRFGLSSLHQLRGRIARSNLQPYCMITGRITTPESRKRLDIILSSHDGFEIAEEDLKLRGAGELFGTRQHGSVQFSIGDPVMDVDIMAFARQSAAEIVLEDPKISKKVNATLKRKLKAVYKSKFNLAGIS